MKAVKSKGTKPELIVHKYLRSKQIKHKMHPKMFSNPDFIIPQKKVAIFYNGCFWHMCNKCFKNFDNLNDFWLTKLKNNAVRDENNHRKLKSMGWKVIKIWGHDMKNENYKRLLDLKN